MFWTSSMQETLHTEHRYWRCCCYYYYYFGCCLSTTTVTTTTTNTTLKLLHVRPAVNLDNLRSKFIHGQQHQRSEDRQSVVRTCGLLVTTVSWVRRRLPSCLLTSCWRLSAQQASVETSSDICTTNTDICTTNTDVCTTSTTNTDVCTTNTDLYFNT